MTVADYIKWVQVKPDAAYLALRDGSNILDTTLLKLKHDEILELSSDLGFKFTKSNVPDSMNLSLTVFSTYYRNEGRVGIKFTKEAKRFYVNLLVKKTLYNASFIICCSTDKC